MCCSKCGLWFEPPSMPVATFGSVWVKKAQLLCSPVYISSCHTRGESQESIARRWENLQVRDHPGFATYSRRNQKSKTDVPAVPLKAPVSKILQINYSKTTCCLAVNVCFFKQYTAIICLKIWCNRQLALQCTDLADQVLLCHQVCSMTWIVRAAEQKLTGKSCK